MSNETRQYKNDVFCMLMEYPEYALSVYNALNKTDYKDPSIVKIMTIDSGVSLTVNNDAAFVVGTDLNLYEHQSSICPNMPLRFLPYYTTMIRADTKDKNIYGNSLVKIQVPHFIVFYNGANNYPERIDLKLSDAFIQKTDSPDIELICHVYNINPGYNSSLVDNCKVLKGYSAFTGYVREFFSKHDAELDEAVKCALDLCIEKGILSEFFRKKYDEVMKMIQLDYTFERRIELQKEESYSEGHSDGMNLHLIEQICKKLKKGKDISTIADELEEEEAHISAICSTAEKFAPNYDAEKILSELNGKETV